MANSPISSPAADAHEASVENREAYEYWGYLFKADKTGTDKLKSLLRGLKEVMNCNYENTNNRTPYETSRPASGNHSIAHEQPDLTPTQLAHFYRDVHGNYDQLFLATPNESIAFIYKSLGCLHSLQPLHHTTQTEKMANGDRAGTFTDPEVPALKTEGWIMWQTIQILLGPEEHAQFLREAVEKWDVKDVETGDVFPKILPRECFPREPDRHMVAWYEGVSERLRKEAEAEEEAKFQRHREDESDEEGRPRRLRGSRVEEDESDEESVDSRAPALAYFRNPLYRHVDGRPSIVRRNSKRPGLSPRQTMMDKGKEAVGSMGRIARNVASPHLWDGRAHSHSRSGSAHTSGGKRRQSHSHLHHSSSPPDDPQPPTSSGSDRREHAPHHRRRTGSSQLDVPPHQQRPTSAVSSSVAAEDEWWDNSEPASPPTHHSPPAAATAGAGLAGAAAAARHGSRHARSHSQHAPPREAENQGHHHRRNKSAEPTPSGPHGGGREADDYFGGHNQASRRGSAAQHEQGRRDSDESAGDGNGVEHRRNSTTPPPVPAGNGVGVSFGPSKGPLFASHVARQTSVAGRGGRGDMGGRDGNVRRGSPDLAQHHQHRPRPAHGRQDYPPERRREGHRNDERYDSPRRSGRGGGGYDPNQNQRFDDGYRNEGRRMSRDAGPGGGRRYPEDDMYDNDPPPRRSREDVGGRRSRKQTRFAGDGAGERGVSGRRYPDGSPWGRGE